MPRRKSLGGITVAIAGSWALVVHAVPIVTVAVSGKHAVGLSGNYESIYNLTLTDTGLAAFKATVRNPEYIGGLWAGSIGNPQLIIRDGGPAPGMPDTTVDDMWMGVAPVISNNRQLAFSAGLAVTGVPERPNTNTAFWAGPTGSPLLVAKIGAAAPGIPGAYFADYLMLAFPTIASGRTIFANEVAGPGIDYTNREGLWEGPFSAPQLLFRSPQHAPGTPDGVNFGDFWGPLDRKSTRLNSSHSVTSRMPSSA